MPPPINIIDLPPPFTSKFPPTPLLSEFWLLMAQTRFFFFRSLDCLLLSYRCLLFYIGSFFLKYWAVIDRWINLMVFQYSTWRLYFIIIEDIMNSIEWIISFSLLLSPQLCIGWSLCLILIFIYFTWHFIFNKWLL